MGGKLNKTRTFSDVFVLKQKSLEYMAVPLFVVDLFDEMLRTTHPVECIHGSRLSVLRLDWFVSIYPCLLALVHGHRGNHSIALMPVRQPKEYGIVHLKVLLYFKGS